MQLAKRLAEGIELEDDAQALALEMRGEPHLRDLAFRRARRRADACDRGGIGETRGRELDDEAAPVRGAPMAGARRLDGRIVRPVGRRPGPILAKREARLGA